MGVWHPGTGSAALTPAAASAPSQTDGPAKIGKAHCVQRTTGGPAEAVPLRRRNDEAAAGPGVVFVLGGTLACDQTLRDDSLPGLMPRQVLHHGNVAGALGV